MRGIWRGLVVIVAAPAFLGFDCGSGTGQGGSALAPAAWRSPAGVSVAIATSPFGFSVTDSRGRLLLESAPADQALGSDDPLRAYAPAATTHDTETSGTTLMYGWTNFRGVDDPWRRSAQVTGIERGPSSLAVHVATDDGTHPFTITFTDAAVSGAPSPGLRIVAALDAPDPQVNRFSLGFALHDDDHFMGLGERFVYGDHRGQQLYTWVEDGGFGQGEGTPVGPANPSPNGPGQTNMPIPWFMDPRGFGLLLNTTWRTTYHLGDERADAFRIESFAGSMDMTLFADPDPANLVESLTAVTGRPPPIADWVLAPRRRANDVDGEIQKLRSNHVATSVIDTATHYFPAGTGQDHAALKALTDDMHGKGLKAVAYFCPFVADSWHPVFDDAAAKGYLVKHADGTPYVVIDPPYSAAMVDFTNPDAVAWYQSFLQQAVDDGWDGWMYDFAEYVPEDAVMANGKTGAEMHNEYPLLYQQAAYDFFQRTRPGDNLYFVRSGYAGTGGRVPMVWAGDQNTDFDLADGLPAALCGALNVGMSGVPLWGSDISGYHFLYNPPPDEEEYLRWTELGAFSADMHDENDGAGTTASSTRWQIWKSARSIATYAKYASLKTRMLPYTRVAVREARERGLPVMRHLYLTRPTDPRVYAMQDEYLFGDALLVAPVVTRGATSRSVYLPEPQYFDYWTGQRVTGGGDVTASAPLETVPVYARVGAIVPLLWADVETVVPDPSHVAVSMQDRAGMLEVQVFAGGDSSLTLDDGTAFEQHAPASPFAIGASVSLKSGAPVAPATSSADLATCAACYLDDPASHTASFALVTASDTITAGPLTLAVTAGASSTGNNVKRYLFSVHY